MSGLVGLFHLEYLPNKAAASVVGGGELAGLQDGGGSDGTGGTDGWQRPDPQRWQRAPLPGRAALAASARSSQPSPCPLQLLLQTSGVHC